MAMDGRYAEAISGDGQRSPMMYAIAPFLTNASGSNCATPASLQCDDILLLVTE